jgi:hypothetical protein
VSGGSGVTELRAAPWSNLGGNVGGVAALLLTLPPAGDDLRAGVALVREALERAGDLRVRAHGMRWSFSGVIEANEAVIDTRNHAGALPAFDRRDLEPGVDPASLLHVWSGTRLSVAAQAAERAGRSLPVINGRGGLTVAGAVSTGSHGAAIDLPPLADHVRALLLVVSSTRALWVERASAPVVAEAWCAERGFELVRDDEALDAAVVGLGCFGVIASIVFETVEAFDLDHHWLRLPNDTALRAWTSSLDPLAIRLPEGAERPYHVNLVINPHRAQRVRLSVGYRRPSISPPSNARMPSVAPPVGGLLTGLATTLPASSGPVLELLIAGAARPARLRGPLGTVFPDRTPSGYQPISMEVAVPLEHGATALDLVLGEASRRVGGYRYPGFLAVRWMRGSRALLGFTAFPRTVTLELPSIGGVPGTLELHQRVREGLEAAGLPWTEHPGQANAWSRASVGSMFGERVGRWEVARRGLLREDADRFGNGWAQGWGTWMAGLGAASAVLVEERIGRYRPVA